MRLLRALLPLLPALASAISVTFVIPPSQVLPDPSSLTSSTVASLTNSGTSLSVPISPSNTFTFHNLTKGTSYLLDVYAYPYIVFPARVDVFADGSTQATLTFRENAWSHRGEVMRRDGLGRFEVRVVRKGEYYYKREGFSPKALLMNPMILIAIVSLFALLVIPKIIDNLDPEMKAEFEAQQAKTLSAGGFDMASMLAGTSAAGPAAKKTEPSAPAGKGKKGKK